MGGSSSKKKKEHTPEKVSTPATPAKPEIIAGKSYKLVILGDGGVGKTAITIRFVSDRFVPDYDPTVEDAYKKDYEIDGKNIIVEIIDTAGQEEYSSGLHDKYIRDGEGFICVYSIASKTSFQRLKELRDKIAWTKDAEKVPIALVGNKSDLVRERQVSIQEGKDLAAEFNCPFVETSAKTADNVHECMRLVLMEIAKFAAYAHR